LIVLYFLNPVFLLQFKFFNFSNAIAPIVTLWMVYAEMSTGSGSETPLWLLMFGAAGKY
jgi:hypothetical protein